MTACGSTMPIDACLIHQRVPMRHRQITSRTTMWRGRSRRMPRDSLLLDCGGGRGFLGGSVDVDGHDGEEG
jgi:hypothetical protein